MCTPDLTQSEIQALLSESYRSFYQDKRFLFRKFASKKGTIRANPEFRWARKFIYTFLRNGITKFVMQLDKIVDEVYEAT